MTRFVMHFHVLNASATSLSDHFMTEQQEEVGKEEILVQFPQSNYNVEEWGSSSKGKSQIGQFHTFFLGSKICRPRNPGATKLGIQLRNQ